MIHDYIVHAIIENIKKRGNLSEATIMAGLREWGEDKILSTWAVEDVIDRVKTGYNKKISRKKALEVLEDMDRHFDASIGLNWDVMDNHIEQHIKLYD